MKIKWKIFILTFLTYASIYAIRISWVSLKPYLNQQPFIFSTKYLGLLDMLLLFSLAIALVLVGPKIQKIGPKKFLLIGMMAVTILSLLMFTLLFYNSTHKIIYAVIYCLIGFASCVGWPACLYLLYKYFTTKNIVILSIWNSSPLFGSLIAVTITYLTIQKANFSISISLLICILCISIMIIIDSILLPRIPPKSSSSSSSSRQNSQQIHEQSPPPQLPEQKIMEMKQIQSDNQMKNTIYNHKNNSQSNEINCISVWSLPGIFIYFITAAVVKSVNIMVLDWLVFYLFTIDMAKQAAFIGISWTLSIFIGGIIASYINPNLSKWIFIATLIICALIFIFLEELHLHPDDIEIFILTIICGLLYGGPYNLMSTTVPLMLSNKPEIKNKSNARPVIIATMEGFNNLVAGITVIIIPEIGVINMHFVATIYCFVGAFLLLAQIIITKSKMYIRNHTKTDEKNFNHQNVQYYNNNNNNNNNFQKQCNLQINNKISDQQ